MQEQFSFEQQQQQPQEDCTNCGQSEPLQTEESNFTCPPNTFAYIVRPGDTMFTIARQFNVSLEALIEANPQIPDPARLRPGQTVCVPRTTPPPPVTCPPNTFAYIVRPGDTMFSIARQFDVSLEALIAANPQIPDPARLIPGQTVCVPRTTPPPPVTCPPNTFAYIVQPGDSMFSIAQRFGVSLDALIAANPQITNPALIFPGQTVCVPRTGGTCPPNTFAYIVQPGDSMFSIAQRFGVSLNALIAANPQITNPALIFPGQTVCVPRSGTGTCPPGTFAYTVQPGDSMFLIAQRFGVSLSALIAANPQIQDPSRIFPGQTVCVPTTTGSSQCPPGTFRYTVQPGDSMFSIAQRFGISLNTLIAANPQISDPAKIKPGQIVCVPQRG